jgi:glycerol uptake facilitator-like aquaporin
MVVETLGTALLTGVIVGCGIGAEQWTVGDAASAAASPIMIGGTIAASAIVALAAASGFCLNPALMLALAIRKRIDREQAPKLAALQLVGAFSGVMLAHWAFDRDLVETGVHTRWASSPSLALWLTPLAQEFAATLFLAAVLLATHSRCAWLRAATMAFAALAVFWFGGSTSIANPAVVIGGGVTSSLFGLRPEDAPALITAQFAGASLAGALATAAVKLRK